MTFIDDASGQKAVETVISDANSGIIKVFEQETLFKRYVEHLFANDHVTPAIESSKGMLLKLGNSKEEVFNKVVNIIKHVDSLGLLKEGTNQTGVSVNGIPTIIKVHINGLNAFAGTDALVKEHLIELVDKIF